MKTIIQSLVISFIIHLIYLLGTVGVSYIKTIFYKPDYPAKVEILQSKVAFGAVGSPLFFLVSFVIVTMICGLVIISYRKVISLKKMVGG